jgi:hypothetical protein
MKPPASLLLFSLLLSPQVAADERVPVRSIATSINLTVDADEGPLRFSATLRDDADKFGRCHFFSTFAMSLNDLPISLPAELLKSIRSPRLEQTSIYSVLGSPGLVFVDIPFGDSSPVVSSYRDRSLLRVQVNPSTRSTERILVLDFQGNGRHLERQIFESTK